jgi:spore germination protein YaaH
VQIDFEAIPSRDRDNFVEFMRLLKAGLRGKSLSVALPARLSESGDALGYARLAAVVDRVIIMAYDEHWSTSAPGPVASMDWSERVAAFAVSKIGPEKLVMGLPFYGRAWGDKRTDRAYKYSAIESLIEEKGVGAFFREREIPWFQYEELVVVKVFYDDAESTLYRLRLYQKAGAKSVAFWRLGQEDPDVWKSIHSGK